MQDKKCTPVNFAEHLDALIKQRGITQKKLASDIGASEASVVKWLKGSMPLGENLNKLASYFSLHPDFLLNPKRYRDIISEADKEAEAMPGTEQQKNAAFNRRLMVESDKLKIRQEGFEAAMSLQEPMPTYGENWRTRCLAAETQLARLKALLITTAENITLPNS